jgi:hypothetical protein
MVRDAMFAIIHEAAAKIDAAKMDAAETGKTIDPDASVQANIRRRERQISFNQSIIMDVRVMLEKLDLLRR